MDQEEVLQKTRLAIVAAGKQLLQQRLVAGTWGNVSCRVPGTAWIAVTPSGRDYESLRPEEVAVVDLEGRLLQCAAGHKASSELPLHLAIYRRRPDVTAVVHTHSVHASACAVARRCIPPVIEDIVQLAGGEIPLAKYALPGTADLAEAAVAALGKKYAVLLANHGAVCCGTTLAEAMTAAELVEKAAQIYLYAHMLGGAHPLSEEDVQHMHEFYQTQYRNRRGD